MWRIGRGPDPLAPRPAPEAGFLSSPRTGNRLDSPVGVYRVQYFGSSLEACFGETLARYRPDPGLETLLGRDWDERGFMPVGSVPAEWRQRRIAVRATFEGHGPFLDVEATATHRVLRTALADVLAVFGYQDLDAPTVRGSDRRVTRAISYWAWQQTNEDGTPAYAGLRYFSRLNSRWECWAVFDGVPIEELERITISRDATSLRRVARLYGLTVH